LTASLEAMEVMSGVIPLDFRREEIAIRDIGKIYSYSAKIPTFLCTVFNLSRLSLFPICHTQLAYCKTEPIKLL
jgi:hypothetical protein